MRTSNKKKFGPGMCQALHGQCDQVGQAEGSGRENGAKAKDGALVAKVGVGVQDYPFVL